MKQNNNRTQFAVCIADDQPSLEQGKIYRVLPDAKGAEIDWLRIVDDSGEDYLPYDPDMEDRCRIGGKPPPC
jgi:hypothetical protein